MHSWSLLHSNRLLGRPVDLGVAGRYKCNSPAKRALTPADCNLVSAFNFSAFVFNVPQFLIFFFFLNSLCLVPQSSVSSQMCPMLYSILYWFTWPSSGRDRQWRVFWVSACNLFYCFSFKYPLQLWLLLTQLNPLFPEGDTMDNSWDALCYGRFSERERQVSSGWNTWVISFLLSCLALQIIRLEGQVARYKNAAENAEKVEDELKAEKRKLQREVIDLISFSALCLFQPWTAVFCLQALFFCNLWSRLLNVFGGGLRVYQCCIQKIKL